MKHHANQARTCLVALLLGITMPPAHADEPAGREPCGSFEAHDTDRNGFLSMEEFKIDGKDDLAFRAADINGDERVDPDEFGKYLSKVKNPESGAREDAMQPQPRTPGGY